MTGFHHGAESRIKIDTAAGVLTELAGTTSYGLSRERNTSESTTHSDRATRVTAGSIENGGIGIEGELTLANYTHLAGIWGKSTPVDFEYLPDSITGGANKFAGTGRLSGIEITCPRDETVSFTATVTPTGTVTYS